MNAQDRPASATGRRFALGATTIMAVLAAVLGLDAQESAPPDQSPAIPIRMAGSYTARGKHDVPLRAELFARGPRHWDIEFACRWGEKSSDLIFRGAAEGDLHQGLVSGRVYWVRGSLAPEHARTWSFEGPATAGVVRCTHYEVTPRKGKAANRKPDGTFLLTAEVPANTAPETARATPPSTASPPIVDAANEEKMLPTRTPCDWPRWRGPNGDGVLPAVHLDLSALRAGPEMLWKCKLGDGYSAASVAGERLYTMGYQEGQEVVHCLDAASGQEFWRFAYECPTHPKYPGTRCTPLVADGRVHVISFEGEAYALNAQTGTMVWRTDTRPLGAKIPMWGVAASPIPWRDMILYNAGKHGVALRSADGSVAWQSSQGGDGYASPVIGTVGGKPVAVFWNREGAFGVTPDDGTLLWSFPWPQGKPTTQYTADPLLWEDYLLVSAVYSQQGTGLIPVHGVQKQPVWTNPQAFKSSSPILLGEHIYAPYGNKGEGVLSCVPIRSGKVAWEQDLRSGISLLALGGHLVILTHHGEVRICKADPSAYREELAFPLKPAYSPTRPRGFRGRWWTAPAYAGGRLFCRRDDGLLLCLRVPVLAAQER